MKRLSILFVSLAFAATLAAQGPGRRGPHPGGERAEGPPAPRFEKLTEYLSLTDTQLASLADVRKAHFGAVRDDMRAAGEKRRQASAEMRKSSPDSTLVGQLLVDAQRLEAAVREKRKEMVAQSRAVLNPDQTAKLAQLEALIPLMGTAREAGMAGLLEGEQEGHGSPGFGMMEHFRGGPRR